MVFIPGDLLYGGIQGGKGDCKNNWNKMEGRAEVNLMSEGERSHYLAISSFCKRQLFLSLFLFQPGSLSIEGPVGWDSWTIVCVLWIWGWSRFLPFTLMVFVTQEWKSFRPEDPAPLGGETELPPSLAMGTERFNTRISETAQQACKYLYKSPGFFHSHVILNIFPSNSQLIEFGQPGHV